MAFYCMVIEDAVPRSSVIFSVLKLVNHTEEDVASNYIVDYLKEINILGKFFKTNVACWIRIFTDL